MKVAIRAVCLLGLSSAANANPTYLSCSIDSGGAPSLLSLTLDEANSIVTAMVAGTRAPQRMAAAFEADQITFGNSVAGYRLDRSNLNLVRTIYRMNWVDSGPCRIVRPGRRAI